MSKRGAVSLAQGHTLPDASRLLGVSSCALRRALIKAGLYTLRFQKAKVVGLTEVINRQQTAKERHVAIAAKLATENGGKIPSCGWLRANGYGLTYIFIRKHPDWFAHLPRERAKTGPRRHNNTFDAARAIRLYEVGMPVAKIDMAFGYPPQHGNNRGEARLSRQVFTTRKKNRASAARLVRSCDAASAVVNRPFIQQDNLAFAEQDK